MSEMLERAARAAWLVGRDWNTPDSFDAAPDYAKDVQRDVARAALLAALDPEDEALCEKLARALFAQETRAMDGWTWEKECGDGELRKYWLASARVALLTLRQAAQGGTEP